MLAFDKAVETHRPVEHVQGRDALLHAETFGRSRDTVRAVQKRDGRKDGRGLAEDAVVGG